MQQELETEIDRRVQFVGKDMVFVDGVLYLKEGMNQKQAGRRLYA